ncbi:NYN domain-containing protein [Zeimonas arvi]|uniref:NYN domain-containing protein n=1 Tax=Zeimonas arvi TaxID=2498847 RepID=A0A5C8NUG5_9BURK|nr:NYN domain-containing protein [Zeimonas arvi]TXL64823.1 NYN domain-containing protein [Zeimonas arvi]
MKRRSLGADPAEAPRADADSAQDRLAVLIDADNAHAAVVDGLLAEIARYGVASVKRIYGDWTQPQLGSWKKVLLEHSIVPVQQFAYTKGKNATDSALIIDAMDLMYTRRFDGFCLVSSDSDFTRLASRLREEGLLVYGFGERKTPSPFVSACDRFVYTEVLRGAAGGKAAAGAGQAGVAPKRPTAGRTAEAPSANGQAATRPAGRDESREGPRAEPQAWQPTQQGPEASSADTASLAPAPADDPLALVGTIANAIDAVSDETGWAGLGAVGRTITKLKPDFDSRLYGHRKFSDLVRSLPERFELDERTTGAGKSLFVRLAPGVDTKAGSKTRGGKAPRKRKAAAKATG